MKVSSTEAPPRQVVLDIEVEQARLDRAMERAFRRISDRVNVPGFRKGKAPRALVERMVGREAIAEDAIEHLAPEVVNEALDQQGITPYARPRVEIVDLEPLRVKATVPLPPKVELGDYTTLRIPREEVTIEPDQVQSVVERLRESYAQWAPVERTARLGDRVGLDVRGEVEETGRVLVDSHDAEYVVDPEGAQPAPGFADQIVGLDPGAEKTFTLALDEGYRDRELAGKAVIFSVKLHWVKERQLPEVDDAFAQQVGEYADAAALRSAVEAQLRERETARAREALDEAAVDKLVEISTVEMPPQLVEHQAQHLLESLARNVERQGLKLDQYLRFTGKDEEALRGELRERAESQVKRSLALDAFATQESVVVAPEEVDAEVRKAAAEAGSDARVAQAAADSQMRARVEEALRERKALARLVALAAGEEPGAEAADGTAERSASAGPGATDTLPDTPLEAPTLEVGAAVRAAGEGQAKA